MNLLEGMKQNSTITNSKGGKYYQTTYDSNLDLFTKLSRYTTDEEIIRLFNSALNEDEELALANLLYILDVREGKGERRIFKTIFKNLCTTNSTLALKVLPFISKLGRYDYILVGLDTKINDEVISLIKMQLAEDLKEDHPSLLAKWLPSHRTHNKNSLLAKKIRKGLNMSEKEYRQTLSLIRKKLNIVERNLTTKQYNNIVFSELPAKAMLKYTNTFQAKMTDEYTEYKKQVANSNEKINTKGLFPHEIIRNILTAKQLDNELYNLMWENQKDVLKGCNSNILVMADTSNSMTRYDLLPYSTSIGLALISAEHNTGLFKNHFLTFSNEPYLHEIKGKTIFDKIKNIHQESSHTNIDKAFELLLTTAKENNLTQSELPSHLLIISDMEFASSVSSKNGTNFSAWQESFTNAGYKLPNVIFWNVAGRINGVPVTKFDNDVALVSGFSPNILTNLFSLDVYTPNNIMLEKLKPYLEILRR